MNVLGEDGGNSIDITLLILGNWSSALILSFVPEGLKIACPIQCWRSEIAFRKQMPYFSFLWIKPHKAIRPLFHCLFGKPMHSTHMGNPRENFIEIILRICFFLESLEYYLTKGFTNSAQRNLRYWRTVVEYIWPHYSCVSTAVA